MGASGLRDHIVVCGWRRDGADLIRELQTDEYKQKIVLIHDPERSPADCDVYFVRGSSTNAEDLRRAGTRRGLCGDHLSGERHRRSRHALDLDGPRHRVDRPRGSHRGRGEQPVARRAFPARRGGRAPRRLQVGLAAHGPFGALPGAFLAGHRHRLRRRRLRALPGHAPRGVRRARGGRGIGTAPGRARSDTRRSAAPGPRTPTRAPTSSSRWATTQSWLPRRWARSTRWSRRRPTGSRERCRRCRYRVPCPSKVRPSPPALGVPGAAGGTLALPSRRSGSSSPHPRSSPFSSPSWRSRSASSSTRAGIRSRARSLGFLAGAGGGLLLGLACIFKGL